MNPIEQKHLEALVNTENLSRFASHASITKEVAVGFYVMSRYTEEEINMFPDIYKTIGEKYDLYINTLNQKG